MSAVRDGAPAPGAPTRAKLEGLTLRGEVMVRIGDEICPAELALSCSDSELVSAIRERRAVLVEYIDGDASSPVVVGFLRDRLALTANATREDTMKQAFIELEATNGIALRSGSASIELHPDGRIELHGVEVVSVAEGTNRLMGGRVAIN